MPEGMNIEVAHKLSERDKADKARRRWEEITEVVEVLVLAVGQRFRLPGVRMGAMGLAVGLLVYGLVTAATLPRL